MSDRWARIERMFESISGAFPPLTSASELAGLVGRLAGLSTDVDDAQRVDSIRQLEQVKAAAAAAQARMTAAFVASQRDEQAAAGVPAGRVGQGIAGQVALARRESPARAAKYAGWTTVLVGELPHTFTALQRGETTEWRAMLVARETIWLSREHRTVADAALAPLLPGLGDRQVEAEAKKLAYRLDPHGFLARARAAERDRRVSLRPAPDTMTRLSALLPAAQGVAAYAALNQAAQTARADGDPRGRGQVMADTLVERVTGQTAADATSVEITLVMTDHTLVNHNVNGNGHHDVEVQTTDPKLDPSHGDSASTDRTARPTSSSDTEDGAAGPVGESNAGDADEPAYIVGYGPIPAGLARDLARGSDATGVWLRRLYRHPTTGQLAAIDARRRTFDGAIRHAIIARDQVCRTPWCGAPIRHIDHARPVAQGGPTNLDNGQGLCEACNFAKQAPGWAATPGPGGAGESVRITTPTGHTYTSQPPDLPGAARPRPGPRQRAGPSPPAAIDDRAA